MNEQDKIEIVPLYLDEEKSIAEIAVATGLSATYVRNLLKEAGVYEPWKNIKPSTPKAVEKALPHLEKFYQRFKAGERLYDLASEIGISKSSLYKAFTENGYKISKRVSSRGGKKVVPAERFIEVWQASSSIDEVCDLLGVRKASAYSRAYLFRKKGVPLKKYDSRRKPYLDWGDLAEFAQNLVEDEK